MRIVLICQIYNEIETGCLSSFFDSNASLFDDIVVYDDGSTDGSQDYCKKFTQHVILGGKNQFEKEKQHKQILVEYASRLYPDFIMFLDADEILVVGRERLEKICGLMDLSDLDGYQANFQNLWRSPNYVRTDNLFDDFKPIKLWKHKPELVPYSNVKDGLHQSPEPDYVLNTELCAELVILHTGFISVDRILRKFYTYRSKGQKGQELMRLIDESTISFRRVNDNFLPVDWKPEPEEPKPLSIRDYFLRLYSIKEVFTKPKVTVFSLIYKDVGWLEFVYTQFLKKTSLDNIEFYFVANDANESVISFMLQNYIPFYNFSNTEEHKQEYYINNVYRAYNYGVSKARGEYVLMLNSDMAFSEGWLDALMENCDTGFCVASRLVEQGKLSTGKHGIEKNFGNSRESYDEAGFEAYAESISSNRVEEGGLNMPLLVRKSDFHAVGGYPEGNIVPDSDPFNPVIASAGVPVVSGDAAFIQKLEKIGIRHITARNSIVYHFQEGERRSTTPFSCAHTSDQIAICNDQVMEINGEKVLWGHLLDLPSTIPFDYERVESKMPESFKHMLMIN